MSFRANIEALADMATLPIAAALALVSGFSFALLIPALLLLIVFQPLSHPWLVLWAAGACVLAPANAVTALEALDKLEWRPLWTVVWRSAVALATFAPAWNSFA